MAKDLNGTYRKTRDRLLELLKMDEEENRRRQETREDPLMRLQRENSLASTLQQQQQYSNALGSAAKPVGQAIAELHQNPLYKTSVISTRERMKKLTDDEYGQTPGMAGNVRGAMKNAAPVLGDQRRQQAEDIINRWATRKSQISGTWQPPRGSTMTKAEQAEAKRRAQRIADKTGMTPWFQDPENPTEAEMKAYSLASTAATSDWFRNHPNAGKAKGAAMRVDEDLAAENAYRTVKGKVQTLQDRQNQDEYEADQAFNWWMQTEDGQRMLPYFGGSEAALRQAYNADYHQAGASQGLKARAVGMWKKALQEQKRQEKAAATAKIGGSPFVEWTNTQEGQALAGEYQQRVQTNSHDMLMEVWDYLDPEDRESYYTYINGQPSDGNAVLGEDYHEMTDEEAAAFREELVDASLMRDFNDKYGRNGDRYYAERENQELGDRAAQERIGKWQGYGARVMSKVYETSAENPLGAWMLWNQEFERIEQNLAELRTMKAAGTYGNDPYYGTNWNANIDDQITILENEQALMAMSAVVMEPDFAVRSQPIRDYEGDSNYAMIAGWIQPPTDEEETVEDSDDWTYEDERNRTLQGKAATMGDYVDHMNNGERSVYFYIYNTKGKDAALEYLYAIENEMLSKSANARRVREYQWAKENPWLSSFTDILMTPARGASAASYMIGNLVNGGTFSPYHHSLDIADNTVQHRRATDDLTWVQAGYAAKGWLGDAFIGANQAWRGMTGGPELTEEDKEGIREGVQQGLLDLKHGGDSAGDSAVTMAAGIGMGKLLGACMTGAGCGASALGMTAEEFSRMTFSAGMQMSLWWQSAQAGALSTANAKETGASDRVAAIRGIADFMAEHLTETIGAEGLARYGILNTALRGRGHFMAANFVLSCVAEGLEEVGSGLFGMVLDRALNRAASEWDRDRWAYYQEHQDEGISLEQADIAVGAKFAGELATEAIITAITTGPATAGNMMMNRIGIQQQAQQSVNNMVTQGLLTQSQVKSATQTLARAMTAEQNIQMAQEEGMEPRAEDLEALQARETMQGTIEDNQLDKLGSEAFAAMELERADETGKTGTETQAEATEQQAEKNKTETRTEAREQQAQKDRTEAQTEETQETEAQKGTADRELEEIRQAKAREEANLKKDQEDLAKAQEALKESQDGVAMFDENGVRHPREGQSIDPSKSKQAWEAEVEKNQREVDRLNSLVNQFKQKVDIQANREARRLEELNQEQGTSGFQPEGTRKQGADNEQQKAVRSREDIQQEMQQLQQGIEQAKAKQEEMAAIIATTEDESALSVASDLMAEQQKIEHAMQQRQEELKEELAQAEEAERREAEEKETKEKETDTDIGQELHREARQELPKFTEEEVQNVYRILHGRQTKTEMTQDEKRELMEKWAEYRNAQGHMVLDARVKVDGHDAKVVGLESVGEDAQVIVEQDGERSTMALDDESLKFSNRWQREVYEFARGMKDLTAARLVLGAWEKSKTGFYTFQRAFSEVYNAARNGMQLNQVQKVLAKTLGTTMTNRVRQVGYETMQTESQKLLGSKNIQDMRAYLRAVRNRDTAAEGYKGAVLGQTIQIDNLSADQMISIQILDTLAQNIGLRIVIVPHIQTKAEKMQVEETEDKQVPEEASVVNGEFINGSNTMLLALDSIEGAIVNYAGHESWHWVKDQVKKQGDKTLQAEVDAFGYQVLERMKKNDPGYNVEDRIREKIEEYEEMGVELTRGEAEEELQADAIMALMNDITEMELMQEQHPSILKKIVDGLKYWARKIRDAIKGIGWGNTEVRTMLATEADQLEAMARKYYDLMKRVGQNQKLQPGKNARAYSLSNEAAQEPVMYSMAGVQAQGKFGEAARMANEMARQGRTDEEIRKATGAIKGFRGRWWARIDNTDMRYNPDPLLRNAILRAVENNGMLGVALEDLYEAKDLYQAYPQLRDTQVTFRRMKEDALAAVDFVNGRAYIEINTEEIRKLEDQGENFATLIEESLQHEVQHIIQHYEGSNEGSNTVIWEQLQEAYRQTAERMNRDMMTLYDAYGDDFMSDIRLTPSYRLDEGSYTQAELEEIQQTIPEEDIQAWGDIRRFWDKYARIMNEDARTLYRNTVGEIEARSQEERGSKLNPDYRNAVAVEDYYDTRTGEVRYSYVGCEELTEEQITGIKRSHGIIVETWQQFLEEIKAARNTTEKKTLYFGRINQQTLEQIAKETQRPDLFRDCDYAYGIDYDHIRHFDKHFETDEDIAMAILDLYRMIVDHDSAVYKEIREGRLELKKDEQIVELLGATTQSKGRRRIMFKTLYVSRGSIENWRGLSRVVAPLSRRLSHGTPASNESVAQIQTDGNGQNGQNGVRRSMTAVEAAAEAAMPDSKVRGKDGRLLLMHHGTNADFTVFQRDKIGSTGRFEGSGFNFTPYEGRASSYGKNVLTGYLDIQHPLSADRKTISVAKLAQIIREADPTGDNIIADYARETRDYGSPSFVRREAMTAARNIWESSDNDVDIYSYISSADPDAVSLIKKFSELGYDGLIHYDDNGEIKTAVAFSSNQFKLADPETRDDQGNVIPLSERFNPEKDDIRYSLAKGGTATREETERAEKINQSAAARSTGMQVDAGTRSAYTDMRLSLTTLNKSEYVTNRDKMIQMVMEATSRDLETVSKWFDDVMGIASMIAADRTRLDYVGLRNAEGELVNSALKSNPEYGGSIDMSLICAKRRLMTGTIDAIQRRLGDSGFLTAEEMMQVRNMLLKKGYQAACGLCFVESSRKNMGKLMNDFRNAYMEKHKGDGAFIPSMTDINTVDGLADLEIQHPDVYWELVAYMNKMAQRKPKMYEVRTEYNNEILKRFSNDGTVEAKNLAGGLRINSFSDFEVVHLIDMMQVIMDMSAVGLAGQAYTKVPDFAWALGGTGLKINLSMIAKGVGRDGKIIFDEVEGMKAKDAFDLRNEYSDNVGTILVVFTDAQLRAAVNDDRIDFIIPFHRSQWKKADYPNLGLAKDTRDYTMHQNERWLHPSRHLNANGNKTRPRNFMPNEYWDFSLSGKENAKRYLQKCAEEDRRPKFAKYLVDNHNGTWSLPEDGSMDGYWKLLIDFKMYNNKGEGRRQMPVQPIFNMEQCERMLRDYKGGHDTFPVADDVVDEFMAQREKERGKRKAAQEGTSFSMSRPAENSLNGIDETDPGMAQLLSENERFRNLTAQLAAELNRQEQRSTAQLTSMANMNRLARELRDKWRVALPIKTMAENLRKIFEGLSQAKTVAQAQAAMQALGDFSRDAILNAQTTDRTAHDQYSEARGLIRRNLRADRETILDVFGDMSSYRKNGFGRVKLVNQGMNVDSLYTEIRDNYPGTLPDGLVNEADQLRAMLDFLDATDIRSYNPYEEGDEARMGGTVEVVSRELAMRLLRMYAEGGQDAAVNGMSTHRMDQINGLLDRAEVVVQDTNRTMTTAGYRGMTSREYTQRISDLRRELQQRGEAVQQRNATILQLETELKDAQRQIRDGQSTIQTLRTRLNNQQAALNSQQVADLKDQIRQEEAKVRAAQRAAQALQNRIDRSRQIQELNKIKREILRRKASLLKKLNQPNRNGWIPLDMEDAVRELLTAVDTEGDISGRPNAPLTAAALQRAKAAYESINKPAVNGQPAGPMWAYYNGDLAQTFDDLARTADGKRARDLSQKELEQLRDIVAGYAAAVINEDRMFTQARSDSLRQMGGEMIQQAQDRIRTMGEVRVSGPLASWISQATDRGLLKPVTVFDRFNGTVLGDIWRNALRPAEWQHIRNIQQAEEFLNDALDTYHQHESLNADGSRKQQRTAFTLSSGRTIHLTDQELMTLYAWQQRERLVGTNHLLGGGVKLANPQRGDTLEEYRLTAGDLQQFNAALNQEQRDYVDHMVEYLSTTVGEWGNAVTRELYGIEKFRETYYLPFTVAQSYVAQQPATQQDQRIKTASFTKALTDKATTTLELRGFTELWASHVEQMSDFNAFTLPMEDVVRLMNYKEGAYDDQGNFIGQGDNVRPLMERAWGKNTVGYIHDFLSRLNGNSRNEAGGSWLNTMMGRAKGAAVTWNLSVAFQQAGAGVRAMAEMDPRDVLPSIITGIGQNRWFTNNYRELMKYAPIAVEKSWGYFDTNMNRGLYQRAQTTFRSRLDDAGGWLAGKGDELNWSQIWAACKHEIRRLNPNMTEEEVKEHAAERFVEVIDRTQVVDSIFQRSAFATEKGMMRGLMSFMSEPVTMYNMVVRAVDQYRDAIRSKDQTARRAARVKAIQTTCSITLSAALTAFLKSLATGLRDRTPEKKDEDGNIIGSPSYMDKVLSAWAPNFAENLMGLTTIFGNLYDNAVSNYGNSDLTTAWISNIYNAGKEILKGADADWDKVAYRSTQALSNLTGIGFAGLYRDTKAVFSTVREIMDPESLSGTAWDKSQPWDVRLRAAERNYSYNKQKGKDYYNGALLEEYMAHGFSEDFQKIADSAIRMGANEGTLMSGFKTKLKKVEPRIQQAAQAMANGDLETYERLMGELTQSGIGMKTASSLVNTAYNALVKPEQEEEDPETGAGLVEALQAEGSSTTAPAKNAGDDLLTDKASTEDVQRAVQMYKAAGMTQDKITEKVSNKYKKPYIMATIRGEKTESTRLAGNLKAGGITQDRMKTWTTDNVFSSTKDYGLYWMIREGKTEDAKKTVQYLNKNFPGGQAAVKKRLLNWAKGLKPGSYDYATVKRVLLALGFAESTINSTLKK